MTKDGAEAEMIANFLGETIGTEKKFDKFMSELTGEQKKNFLDYVKEVIDWFKSAFTNSLPAEIRHIEKLYQKALKEAGENAKTKNDTTNKIDGEQLAIPASKDRANKKGELINEYHQALDRGEWTRYYDIIAEKGWLLSDVGDVAAVVIGNKLIISQRKQITNNTSDFQVIDAYRIEGNDDLLNTLKYIAEKIEWEQEYDNESVRRIYGQVAKQYDENALLTRYVRTEHAFVSDFTKATNGRGAETGGEVNNTESPGKGVLEKTPKAVQETVQGSLRNGTVTEDEQSLIPEDSLTPIGDGRSGGSIPERTRKLRQDFIDGKIGYPSLAGTRRSSSNLFRQKNTSVWFYHTAVFCERTAKRCVNVGKNSKKVCDFALLTTRQIGICQSCNAFISRYFKFPLGMSGRIPITE